ncbi:hypothetical protein TW95_gp1599 [Pandoravirus inopinatum]|uniref:Uncharacterized protein n=1 Tax=Pandoravirus inopinatum TaxID=1605721 RepID=A0A0B5IZK1_9VIRU|nr:hypothetical protein TW95_gp1599 [Pandoravirus inopinatum]AJF98333.1 hypothetical protein [Pandoravirus inopinatum]
MSITSTKKLFDGDNRQQSTSLFLFFFALAPYLSCTQEALSFWRSHGIVQDQCLWFSDKKKRTQRARVAGKVVPLAHPWRLQRGRKRAQTRHYGLGSCRRRAPKASHARVEQKSLYEAPPLTVVALADLFFSLGS